ncbi:MAG: phage integrase family protein [Bacteroidetes bacterium]|nr:phage integrase family protein [Bacteroidota bacterium]
MSSENIYLHKRVEGGTYYLTIVTTINKKRHFKRVSCRTKNKNEALRFLKNYEKNKKAPVVNPNLKISHIKKTILNYVDSNLSKGSLEKYDLTLRKFIEVIGDKEINLVTIQDVENFKAILSKNIRKHSVNTYIRYVKAIWNLLVKLGIIANSNLSGVKQFKIPEKEIISFTESEIELIVENTKDEKIKNIIMLAVETGLRISELLNLKIKNLDFENELIKVNNTEEFRTKSGKNRIIPFNINIEKIINFALQRKGLQKTDTDKYLFVSKYNIPYKRNFITVYFRRKLDELKFDKRYHFHCLRATFIMNLVRKGVNPIIIQKLAGHSSLVVTQRYCYIQISDLKNALNL